MGRWEPDTRLRLVRAALDLFSEQGYDTTTVSEIAERAGGLTKMTFFRHFRDKREVLFAGQDLHSQILADAIAAAPGPATPLQAVAGALDALTATFTDDRREFSARVLTVIAGNSELQERAAAKRTGLTETMAQALEKRGVPELAAGLAAELGIRAYYRAFGQWADPASQQTLTELTHHALDELLAATATLN